MMHTRDRLARKKRLEELIKKNRGQRKVKYGVLFEECLEALGDHVSILSNEESEAMYQKMQSQFPFLYWGRIDWNKVSYKYKVEDTANIASMIKDAFKVHDDAVYILWGYGEYPVIRTDLNAAMHAIESIRMVGADQWLYNPHDGVITEYYHEGDVMIGKADG